MTPKIKFELWRWAYFVISFFLAIAIGMIVVEIVAVPSILWLFDNTPYTFPDWHGLIRWGLWAAFMGLFAGTVSWYCEKRRSGR